MESKPLIIYYTDADGKQQVRCKVPKWEFYDKAMSVGEQYITFNLEAEKPIQFAIGDYCLYRGQHFYLNVLPTTEQKAEVGDTGDAFKYDSVRMDSDSEKLGRVMMLDITPTTGDYVAAKGTNFTGSAEFQLACHEVTATANGKTQTLTPVCYLANLIKANLDRAYPTDGWQVRVNLTSTETKYGKVQLVTHTDDKVLSFNGTTVAAALAEVNNTFDLDYFIKGRDIYIGYTLSAITAKDPSVKDDTSDDEFFYFGYGKGYADSEHQGKALFDIKRNANTNQQIITRLRAMGSKRNMPYRYYNKKYGLPQSLFPTNLQLPDTFATPDVKAVNNATRKKRYPFLRDVKGDTNDSYLEKNDDVTKCIEGMREGRGMWDGSDSNLEEIYPTIKEGTYRDLRAAEQQDSDGYTESSTAHTDSNGKHSFLNYLDDERVDEVLAPGTTDTDDANIGDGIDEDPAASARGTVDLPLASPGEYLIDNASVKANTIQRIGNYRTFWTYSLGTITENQYAGQYALSPNFLNGLCVGAKLDAPKRSGDIKVGYRILVYATPITEGAKESLIYQFDSTKSVITANKDYTELEIAALPDTKSLGNQNPSAIKLLETSTVRIELSLVMELVSATFDDSSYLRFYVGKKKNTTETYTNFTAQFRWGPVSSSAEYINKPFHMIIKDMGFDLKAQFNGQDEPYVEMQDGYCAGYKFKIGDDVRKVTYTKNGKQYVGYQLSLTRATDSSTYTYYPSTRNKLQSGDHYILTGIQMPDVYVRMAEIKLLIAATQYLADNSETKYTYEPSLDNIYLARNYDRCKKDGDITKSVYWNLYAGLKFPFRGLPETGEKDETLPFINITIESLNIKEEDGYTPKVEMTLNDDIEQSTYQKITTAVDRIYNGSLMNEFLANSSEGGMAKSDMIALIQEQGKQRFISKLIDDTANGLITFLKGLKIGASGNYEISEDGIAKLLAVYGPNYSGASMHDQSFGMYEKNNRGYMVTDYLTVRIKAIFSELEIRKLSYVGGNYIFSHAGSTITTQEELEDGMQPVEEIVENGKVIGYRVYFKADDGDTRTMNMWRVGYMALCQTFNIKSPGTYRNVSNTYYWRLVTEVGSKPITITKQDGTKEQRVVDYVVLSNENYIEGPLTDADGNKYYSKSSDADDLTKGTYFIGCDPCNRTDKDTEPYRTAEATANAMSLPSLANDAPKAGDVIVQVGCQVDSIFDKDGNVIATNFIHDNGGVIELLTEGIGDEPCPAFNIYSSINNYFWARFKTIQISADGIALHAKYFKQLIDGKAGDAVSWFNYRGDWADGMVVNYGDVFSLNGEAWVWQGEDGATPAAPSEDVKGWEYASKRGEKGEGAYSVELSHAGDIVTVDDMGNVIDGIYALAADGSKQWRLATAVFAYKGTDILLQKDEGDEDKGHYSVTAYGDGCTVEIHNSTVYITSIKNVHDGAADTDEEIDYDAMRNMNSCRVTIKVDCEGKATIVKEFFVRIAHSSLPFLLCDLSNEHSSVGWNTKAKKYYGFPVKTVVTLLYHNTPWKIEDAIHVDNLPEGLVATITDVADTKKKQVSIDIDEKHKGLDFLPSVVNASIHVAGVYAGVTYEYSKMLTIDRKADVTLYELVPSADSLILDKDGNLSTNSLTVQVWATSSDDKRYQVTDLAAAGLKMLYGKGDAKPSNAFTGTLSVASNDTKISLALVSASDNNVVYDTETIPVVAWGHDGKGVEFVYYRDKNGTKPSNPTPSDYTTSAKYQNGTEGEYVGELLSKGWTDDPKGVDDDYPVEYFSVRRSTNGVWGPFSEPSVHATCKKVVVETNSYYGVFNQGVQPNESNASVSTNGKSIFTVGKGENVFAYDSIASSVIKENGGKSVWSIDYVTYADKSHSLRNVSFVGDCNDLASVEERYAITDSVSSTPVDNDTSANGWKYTDGTKAAAAATSENMAIWSCDKVTYNKKTSSDTNVVAYINKQLIGTVAENGRGIVSTETKYMRSSDGVNHPLTNNTGWSKNMPTLTDDYPYCWTWTHITYNKAPLSEDFFTVSQKGSDATAIHYEVRNITPASATVSVTSASSDSVGAPVLSGTLSLTGSWRIYKVVNGKPNSNCETSNLSATASFDNGATAPSIQISNGTFTLVRGSSSASYASNDGRKSILITFKVGSDVVSTVTIPVTLAPSTFQEEGNDWWHRITVNGNNVAMLRQDAQSLYSYIHSTLGNLLTGTSNGIGWSFEHTAPGASMSFTENTREFALVNNYYPIGRAASDTYGSAASNYIQNNPNAFATLVSPVVRLEAGKQYIFSFYMQKGNTSGYETPSFGIRIDQGSSANSLSQGSNIGEGQLKKMNVSENGRVRYYYTFQATASYAQIRLFGYISSAAITERDNTPSTSLMTSLPSDLYVDVSQANDRMRNITTYSYYAITSGSDAGKYSVTASNKIYTAKSVNDVYIRKIQLEEAKTVTLHDGSTVADMTTPSDYKESQSNMESYIKQTAESIEIHASQIIFKGETVINGKFSVDNDGTVHMTDAVLTGVFSSGSGTKKITIGGDDQNGEINVGGVVKICYGESYSYTEHITVNEEGGQIIVSAANAKGNLFSSGNEYIPTRITGRDIITDYIRTGLGNFEHLYCANEISTGDISTYNLYLVRDIVNFVAGGSTFTLPQEKQKEGMFIILVQVGDGTIRINGGNKKIYFGSRDVTPNATSSHNGQWTFFHLTGDRWHCVQANVSPE